MGWYQRRVHGDCSSQSASGRQGQHRTIDMKAFVAVFAGIAAASAAPKADPWLLAAAPVYLGDAHTQTGDTVEHPNGVWSRTTPSQSRPPGLTTSWQRHSKPPGVCGPTPWASVRLMPNPTMVFTVMVWLQSLRLKKLDSSSLMVL